MRNNTKKFSAYVLLMSLLTIVIALAVQDETTPGKVHAEQLSAMSNQSTTVSNDSTWEAEVHPILTKSVEEFLDDSQPNVATAQPEVSVSTIQEPAVAPVTSSATPATKKELKSYKVTADHLNVRKYPSVDSRIVKSLPQKTTVKVVQVVRGTWLQLEDGGYVNGKYTTYLSSMPAPKPAKTPAKTTKVSTTKTTKQTATPKVTKTSGKKVSPVTAGINSKSNLTVGDVERILKGTALSGKGLAQAIIDVEHEYGVNAFFTIAVAKLESGNGKSRLAKGKNNLFGMNATGDDTYANANRYKSKAASVYDFGRVIKKGYINKGKVTLTAVNKKYCPPNPKWKNLVGQIVKGDMRKL